MRTTLALVLAMAAWPAVAQEAPDRGPTIEVVGQGKVATPPDLAQIEYWVLGEGKTADDASRALAAKQTAIVAGLSDLLGQDTTITGGEVGVIEARERRCDDRERDNRPVMNAGDCATTGYVARIQGMIRTRRIDRAATAVGLAGRLGARDARLQSYRLVDDGPARRAAVADAVREAKAQAVALAAAAGVTLGPVVLMRDTTPRGYEDIVVTGARAMAAPMVRTAVPAPVAIDVTPRPIETRASVQMIFRIMR